jgi:chaperonin cofactor prefoldin
MKSSEVLTKVKAILGMEVALEENKLENGTVLEAEKFEEGQPVFIVTDDEKVALPMGKYEMEDGKELVVEEEGIIAKIVDAISEEKEEAESEKEEVEAEEQVEEEVAMTYVTKEELTSAVEEVKAYVEKMKEEIEAGYKKMEDVEEEKAELQEQLNKAAVKPFAHSPEKTSMKREQVRFAAKRPQTTLDIVLSKLNS